MTKPNVTFSKSVWWVIAYLTVGCFFVTNRVLPATELVLTDSGEVHLLGVDPYFHVRHAQYSMEHFPEHLRYDPGSHYPSVEYQEYSGLYNLGLALVARVFQPLFSQTNVLERVAAWSPVVLGLFSLFILGRLVFLLWGGWASLLAVILYTLYPGYSLSRTTLGFADQHALEIVLAIASLWGMTRCLQTAHKSRHRFDFIRKIFPKRVSGYAPAVIYALPLAAFSYSWIGYPMYVAISGGVMLLLTVIAVFDESYSKDVQKGLFRYFSGVAIWLDIASFLFPSWPMEWVPNIHQYTIWAMVSFAVFPLLVLQLVGIIPWTSAHRKLTAALVFVGMGLAGLIFLTKTSLGSGFWFWLTYERDQSVLEQQDFSFVRFIHMYGLPGILASLAPLGLILAKVKRVIVGQKATTVSPIHTLVTIVLFSGACISIWVRTHDFDYLPPIFIALLAIFFIREVVQILTARYEHTAVHGIFWALLVGALLWPLSPLGSGRTPWILVKEVRALQIYDAPWHQAMNWLRSNSPNPPLKTIKNGPKESPFSESVYGVISAWDHGNIISYKAGRLPVYSRYPSAGDALWLTARSEADTTYSLCPGCLGNEAVKYAVVSHRMASDLFISKATQANRSLTLHQEGFWNKDGKQVPRITFGATFEKALVTQMFKYNGSGLQHYRLVYESEDRHLVQTVYDPTVPELRITSDPLPPDIEPPRSGNETLTQVGAFYIYDVHVAPAIRIFELVPGAVIKGRSVPNDLVLLRNRLISKGSGKTIRTNAREYEYQQVATADSLGFFEFRVPYSTTPDSSQQLIQVAGPFQLISQRTGTFKPVVISSHNILNGEVISASR